MWLMVRRTISCACSTRISCCCWRAPPQSMRLAKSRMDCPSFSLTCVQQQVSAEDRAEAARCYVSSVFKKGRALGIVGARSPPRTHRICFQWNHNAATSRIRKRNTAASLVNSNPGRCYARSTHYVHGNRRPSRLAESTQFCGSMPIERLWPSYGLSSGQAPGSLSAPPVPVPCLWPRPGARSCPPL